MLHQLGSQQRLRQETEQRDVREGKSLRKPWVGGGSVVLSAATRACMMLAQNLRGGTGWAKQETTW
jgi:hypothetical protein